MSFVSKVEMMNTSLVYTIGGVDMNISYSNEVGVLPGIITLNGVIPLAEPIQVGDMLYTINSVNLNMTLNCHTNLITINVTNCLDMVSMVSILSDAGVILNNILDQLKLDLVV